MAALDRELLLQAEGVQAHCPARRQNRSELRRHDLHRRRRHQLTMNPNRPSHYSCDLSGFLTRWATMIRRSWMAAMTGGSVEATLELWALSLRDVKGRIRPLFQQERMAVSAGLFLDALLGPERRKTGWMRAEAAGDPGPWRQQALLGRAQWDADALRDVVRDYAVETLSEPDAVLVRDETGFLKQGKASCGVARQYTGSAGKITNCQIGVFAVYVSGKGHALIDRALYLPKTWTDDPARRTAAHVPPEPVFAPKPRLARAMIERPPACRSAGWQETRSTG